MPRGLSPNSRKNLEKGKATRFNAETAAEAGRKGAPKSNAKQAAMRSLQERVRIVLNTLIIRKNGEKIDMFSAGLEKAAAQWVLTGDPKYGKILAELSGEFVQKMDHKVEIDGSISTFSVNSFLEKFNKSNAKK